MSILSKDDAQRIMQKAISFSKADHIEVNLGGNDSGNIRYARNSVSTSGHRSNISLQVQSNFGKKSGVTTINEFDDASLEKVVRRSEELAKLAPENPEFMEPQGSQGEYAESKTFYESTANIQPEYRADVADASIRPAKENDITAAGFLNDSAGFSAMMNSKGLVAYNKSSNINLTITMRTNDGTGSGWANRTANDVNMFDPQEASQIAIEKSLMSKNPKAIEPGKYTVILEPDAVWGLLNRLVFSMGARRADEGRSFLSKKGGGNKIGEKIVDEKVNIYSDPFNEIVPGGTWDGNGTPISRTDWVKGGVVENLSYSRFWAEKNNRKPLPLSGSVVMDGGNASIDELIKSTKRGILVTNLWYIRSVDPQTLLHTGLTRDGTFFIENGKIKFPVKNFRFNESPLIMLNNLETLGQQRRVGNALIPTLKIRDFTFTSLSDAI